jgi:hypothetical protein
LRTGGLESYRVLEALLLRMCVRAGHIGRVNSTTNTEEWRA